MPPKMPPRKPPKMPPRKPYTSSSSSNNNVIPNCKFHPSLTDISTFMARVTPSMKDWISKSIIWDAEHHTFMSKAKDANGNIIQGKYVEVTEEFVFGFKSDILMVIRPLFDMLHKLFERKLTFGIEKLLNTTVSSSVDTKFIFSDPDNKPLTLQDLKEHALFLKLFVDSLIHFNPTIQSSECTTVSYFHLMASKVINDAYNMGYALYFARFLTANPLVFHQRNSYNFLTKVHSASKMLSNGLFAADMASYGKNKDLGKNYAKFHLHELMDEDPVKWVVARDGYKSYRGIHRGMNLFWNLFRHAQDCPGFEHLGTEELTYKVRPLLKDIVPVLWYAMACKYRGSFYGNTPYARYIFDDEPIVWCLER